LVNKDALVWREPSRGDVIVFRFPKDRSVDFIKRLIGQPGERIEVCGDRIKVNSELLRDPWGYHEQPEGGGMMEGIFALADCSPVIIPRRGMEVEFETSHVSVEREEVGERGGRFIRDAMALGEEDVGVMTVGEDHFFVMGDNRNNSRDSRAWGFVSKDEVRGKAFMIYWSWDHEKKRVRWERIGRRIQ
jgi:signal peptidase I